MRSSPSATDPLLAGRAEFAHRGLHSAKVPENSMAAFHAAIDGGFGIECDVRLSRDGVAMVFHDEDLERLCGQRVALELLDCDSLMEFRLAETQQSIPRLSDLLEFVAGRAPLLIELKIAEGSAAEPLCRAAARDLGGYDGAMAVMSFNPHVSHWFAAHAPGIRRGLVLGERDRGWRRWRKLRVADPQLLALKLPMLGQRWAQALRRRGMPLLGWTVRTAAERETASVQADALIFEGHGRP